MIGYLEHIDKLIFLFINGHNSLLWDNIMWFVSTKWGWVPLYLSLLFFLVKKEKKQVWIALIFVVLLITLADQISVKLFKDVFLRYRPCHNEFLKQNVHLIDNYCGGWYGFVSSHAANTFALATFFSLIFRTRWVSISLLFWASLVCYSRVYLGVHYPADVICGGMLGVIVALIIYKLFIRTKALSTQISKTKT